MHGCMSMVLMLAFINWALLIFSKFVPMVANDTDDSTNDVIGCRKKPFRIMLLPLVLLANNDCAIRTGSSGNSNRVNG